MFQKHSFFSRFSVELLVPGSSRLIVMDLPSDPGSTEDIGQKEQEMEILTVDLDDENEVLQEEDDGANFDTPPLALTIGTVLDILPKKKVGRILWTFLKSNL